MLRRSCGLSGVVLAVVAIACADRVEESRDPTPSVASVAGDRERDDNGSSSAELPLVIFLGDSLTAGFGIGEEQAFPFRVGQILTQRDQPVRIVNAGVSGDTSAGGVTRLEWLLSQEPDVVVVELGANDGLRGLSLAQTESNLDQIVRRCLEAEVSVLLVGMRIPPSYGPEYTSSFESVFALLAERHSIALMPFLLEGVAADPALNLADGIHPNPRGHAIVAENLTPYLEAILSGK